MYDAYCWQAGVAMARVFPSDEELDFLPEPLNIGEQQVLRLLKRLDDQWLVYVQPRLGQDQPDFIVIHPKLGVTAVEVKDWSPGVYKQAPDGIIHRRCEGGWRPTSEAPRYQAHRYRDTIFSRFFADVNSTKRDFTSVRAVVVMVRHTRHEARELLRLPRISASAEDRIGVWSADDLEQHPMLVLTGYDEPRQVKIPQGNIDRLRRHLAEPEVISDQRLPLSLSSAAHNIERNPGNARIRRVRGAAGSGKSLGLAARAAKLAADGQDVLVVTFNSTLPHYLHDLAARRCREVGASIQRVTFTHLHDFCRRACEDSGLGGFEPMSTQLPGFLDFSEELLERAQDAYSHGFGQRFDAVLVDEGQDFSLKWWNFLRHSVCRPGGEMLLVADPTQDLYNQRAWTDEDRMLGAGFSGPWTEVDGSYRMPPDLIPVVADFAAKHVSGARVDPSVPDDHPLRTGEYEPTVRRWVNLTAGASVGRALGIEVLRLLNEQPDLSPSDIVFLASSHRIGLDAVRTIRQGGHDVQHVFSNEEHERRDLKRRFWAATPGVKGCTFHSFKGWEARAVVMNVTSEPDSHRLAYVGLTRVKGDHGRRAAFVTVVNADRALHSFSDQFMAS
jgi:hypothetical protein